jgi:hypothetical protein
MGLISDIAWTDGGDGSERQIPAAKLHVLQLDPIKAKLGDKWEKLSGLVHKLFEKALRNVQGPQDHFLLVDEMSYVVTFHNLSMEAASLACASVAKEACDLLFGADVEDISVRSLVGLVPSSLLDGKGLRVSDLLEKQGGEIIVSHSSASAPIPRDQKTPSPSPTAAGECIVRAHALAAQSGMGLGLFPVWDLKSRKSASLFLSGTSRGERTPSVRRTLNGADETRIVNMEIALLFAATEYAHRIHHEQKVCSVGTGVSYESLSGFHARIAYIGALKSIQTVASCPILLRIEKVPDGTPHGRLAEIVAMLNVPNVRVTIEFESLRNIADLNIRLGAVGIGWTLPPGCDAAIAAAAASKLATRAMAQKAFAFLHGLNTPELLTVVQANAVRFGSGQAIDANRCYTGQEPVPDFPLSA